MKPLPGSPPRCWRYAALALSLAAHAALLAWLLTARLEAVKVSPPPQAIMLEWLRSPIPATPTLQPKVSLKVPPPRAPLVADKQLAAKPEAAPAAPKLRHAFVSDDSDWVAVAPAAARGPVGPGRVPGDYADQVKARIVTKLERPPGAVFEVAPTSKGDPKNLLRQCTVPYQIVVDRQGRMISHQMESCGDDLLDAAAEAAILKGGPFPPPPDLGADHYIIYGSANFRAQ